MQKAKGEWSANGRAPKTRIGFDVSVETGSLSQALQKFNFCVNERIQIGIDQTDEEHSAVPRTLAQVLEKTRFVFVRYSNEKMPRLQEVRSLRKAGTIGSYSKAVVRRENILPIAAPEIDGSSELLSLKLGRSEEGYAWKAILIAQYRTNLIMALRDPDGFFARDYLEGTEGAKERDAFVAKYLNPERPA